MNNYNIDCEVFNATAANKYLPGPVESAKQIFPWVVGLWTKQKTHRFREINLSELYTNCIVSIKE